MKSSSGQHFVALDHIRAFAAFMVFSWHFLHGYAGDIVPFEGAPALWPMAMLDEGHTGVALFMTLSGYLFAKLLNGKRVIYKLFLWNRALRLLPLLALVVILAGFRYQWANGELLPFFKSAVKGLIFPSLPNGGWSITVEFHFYLMLPALMYLLRRSALLPLALIGAAMVIRLLIYAHHGEIQTLTYWTIVGRLDQFVIGMLACQFSLVLAPHRLALIAIVVAFSSFWWWFDASGGFYHRPSYPSSSSLWIVIPTLEGLAYSAFIVWYEGLGIKGVSIHSKILARLGEYSYSIYLLHFFFVFAAANFIDAHVMNLSNIYIASVWSFVLFIMMIVPGYLSFRFIESPFLRFRRAYFNPVDK